MSGPADDKLPPAILADGRPSQQRALHLVLLATVWIGAANVYSHGPTQKKPHLWGRPHSTSVTNRASTRRQKRDRSNLFLLLKAGSFAPKPTAACLFLPPSAAL